MLTDIHLYPSSTNVYLPQVLETLCGTFFQKSGESMFLSTSLLNENLSYRRRVRGILYSFGYVFRLDLYCIFNAIRLVSFEICFKSRLNSLEREFERRFGREIVRDMEWKSLRDERSGFE